jgi:hypothetical protein
MNALRASIKTAILATRVKRAVGKFYCVVCVLLGLTAPILARGDDTLQPVPANGQCSVREDPQWTPQEIFVWQQVCVGEVADFNKGPNYGGNLDPKRREGLPESRILRPAFLETILLEDKYRKVLRRRGVKIAGARLTDILDLENIQLEDEFALAKSLLEKGVNFSGLRSTYTVSLVGSNITGQFLMIGGHLGGQLALGGAMITGLLRLEEVQIGESLFMDRGTQLFGVNLVDVHVGGQLNLTGSKVKGGMLIQGVQVYSTAHLSRGAEFDGPVDFIFSSVGQNVELAGGFFRQNMDLTGTQIGGELRLGRPEFGPARWAPNTVLTLRNTTVGAVQDLSNSWPDKLDLNGFSYRNLGGIAGQNDPMINRTAEWFEGWLGKQASYAPAPYQQLASVLREQGRPDTADEVLYTGRERDRGDACARWRRPGSCLWLSLLSAVAGYGIGLYTFRVFWSVIVLTALGAVLLGVFSPNARQRGPIWLIGASLHRLLPIVELSKEFTNFFDDPPANENWPNLNRPLQLYFAVHAIFGWALGLIVLAAMSGIIQKR